MSTPVIGLIPLIDIKRESYWMLPGYMDGIRQAGGLPIMLPLTSNPSELQQIYSTCDGFLFTGGQDVSPALYGQEASDKCGETCPARDAMESPLLHMAAHGKKPVLGICRGIQFINAALGGTLYQDIPNQHPSDVEHHQPAPYDVPSHSVSIIPGTPLSELLSSASIDVNSCHHQGIEHLAEGLESMAAAPDGLIEAVYMPSHPFLWAVQWHPEFSYKVSKESRAIFSAFCSAARGS